MLINDYANEIVGFDDAQFAIAIALSQMGESQASTAVLGYKGTYTSSNLNDQIKIAEERKGIEQQLRRKEKGMIWEALMLLDQPESLIKLEEGGVHAIARKFRLSELICTCTIRQVYNQTMRIMSRYKANDLLVLYMDTVEYKRHFAVDLRKKYSRSADGIRNNDLSDPVVAEILKDFRQWVWLNAANGSYSSAYGTPLAFLRFAFSTMYSVSKDTDFYTILNKSGVNLGVGDEESGTTALSFLGIENKQTTPQLDFIDVANKISRASVLLFSHNNSQVAFYDIFSCYRDNVLHEKLREGKRELTRGLLGCNFEMIDSASENSKWHEGAVKNKKAGRIKLCKIFEPIITEGLSQNDICEYYRKALERTDTLTSKDGVRLFSTKEHNTKHYETNSEMLQVIISGYLAMRDLINYFENDNAVASIFNFPTVIFRDRRYLRRFQSIDEYVKYNKEVSSLVDEVTGDVERSMSIVNGLVINDEIWSFLGNSDLTNDLVFKKLMGLPLGYIVNAVENSRAVGKDELLVNSVRNIADACDRIKSFIEQYAVSFDRYAELFKITNQLAQWITSEKFLEYSIELQYGLSISFCVQLERIMACEKNPVKDDKGVYLLQGKDVWDDMIRVFNNLGEHMKGRKDLIETYKKTCYYRTKAINRVYELFVGEEIEGSSLKWEEFRQVFSGAMLLREVVHQYSTKLSSIHKEGKSWLYLMLAEIAEEPQLFKIPAFITSCDDFSFFYRADIPQYPLGRQFEIEQSFAINERRNSALVSIMNHFLKRCIFTHGDFEIAFELLEKYVSKRHSPVVVESELDNILRQASFELGGMQVIKEVSRSVRLQLEGMFEFDLYGYVVYRGERYQVEEATYILKSGYLVKVDYFNRSYSQAVITSEDIAAIRGRLAFG